MTKLVTTNNIRKIIKDTGFCNFQKELVRRLWIDYERWNEFDLIPRPAFHVPGGVIELMPIADKQYFSYKYVNGHPSNPKDHGEMTIFAYGALTKCLTGRPIMISEMTYLTALRTAAVASMVSSKLSDETTLGVIGCGSQAEFQISTFHYLNNISKAFIYDIDPWAMDKVIQNLKHLDIEITACLSSQEVCQKTKLITVCTADKKKAIIIEDKWVQPGTHINGLGGDCPGKTELDPALVRRSEIIVEYEAQARIEGEIQATPEVSVTSISDMALGSVTRIVEMLMADEKEPDKTTIFDSVGIALNDHVILKYINELSNGNSIDLIPKLEDPKNLWGDLVEKLN